MEKTILQYFCGSCNNVLREVNQDSYKVNAIEPCPYCGTLLSETLKRRILNHTRQSHKTVFQKASSMPKLTLDIQELDSILHFLSPNQKICIKGVHTQKLVERICVRAQLPPRYGGLDSKVLLVDGANSSDIYQCVDFAQQYSLDAKKILNGIISSRMFTAYQLASLVTENLQDAIRHYGVRVVIITNLLHFFTNDPYQDPDEMHKIIKQIISEIQKIKDCLVIVTLQFDTQYDYLFSKLFSKTIKIESICGALNVNITENQSSKSVFLDAKKLETIPNH